MVKLRIVDFGLKSIASVQLEIPQSTIRNPQLDLPAGLKAIELL
jgi:hypothetical protein